jgi:DNA-binding response OmpR family regulator
MSPSEPVRRALIVDNDKAATSLIRSLLLDARRYFTTETATAEEFWASLAVSDPEVIFIAQAPPFLDAAVITRQLRFSDLASRQRPVIMLAEHPTPGEVRAARDSGVDEVLKKPFTARALVNHVDVASSKSRDWVEGMGYVGPDRRRFNSASYHGQRRRRTDRAGVCPHKERIGQALKIMKSAIDALDTQPKQAIRALYAQADEIQIASVALADYSLASTAQILRAYLDTANRSGCFDRQALARDLYGMFDPGQAQAARKAG